MLEVARGVGELGEDEHLLPGCGLVRLEEFDERLELVVALGFHGADEFEELGELVEVVVGVDEDFADFVDRRIELLDGGDFLLAHKILGQLLLGLAGEKLGLMLAHVVDELVVANLPLLEVPAVVRGNAVRLDPRKEFFQQPPARQLEGAGGTLEALEKLHADERDDLRLASLFQRLLALLPQVAERVVDRQGEEGLGFAERLFDALEQAAIGGLELVSRDARRLAGGKEDRAAFELPLAFLHIRAAALDDEMLEERLLLERGLGDGEFELLGGIDVLLDEELFFQRDEMAARAVDAEVVRGFGEVAVVRAGHEPEDVAEVVDGIVDRRGGEEKELLRPRAGLVQRVLEQAVA